MSISTHSTAIRPYSALLSLPKVRFGNTADILNKPQPASRPQTNPLCKANMFAVLAALAAFLGISGIPVYQDMQRAHREQALVDKVPNNCQYFQDHQEDVMSLGMDLWEPGPLQSLSDKEAHCHS